MSELRQQNDEKTKELSAPLPNNNASTDLGTSSTSINTPAINTGGREATPLRTVGISGSSSALDLIKKKLQDSGTPVASSPISAPTVAQSDVNLPRDADATVKALQTENKDKPKDANADGNVSDSSSDSEDVDSGPTNEQLIIQFKVSSNFPFIGDHYQNLFNSLIKFDGVFVPLVEVAHYVVIAGNA